MKAVCTRPVEIYDEGLTGVYRPGQVVEGEKARLLVERYPEYFDSRREAPAKKEGK